MAFQLTLPAHEQDAFDETLDEQIQVHDQTLAAAKTPLSADDIALRDYLVRKVKEMIADAPIVATHLIATIGGHANNGGNVFVPGTGVSPGFWISVGGAAEVPIGSLPPPLPETGSVASTAALEGTTGIGTSPPPAHQGVAAASGAQSVPTPANPSVPSTEDEAEDEGAEVPTDAPVEPPAEQVEPAALQTAGGAAPDEAEPFVG